MARVRSPTVQVAHAADPGNFLLMFDIRFKCDCLSGRLMKRPILVSSSVIPSAALTLVGIHAPVHVYCFCCASTDTDANRQTQATMRGNKCFFMKLNTQLVAVVDLYFVTISASSILAILIRA